MLNKSMNCLVLPTVLVAFFIEALFPPKRMNYRKSSKRPFPPHFLKIILQFSRQKCVISRQKCECLLWRDFYPTPLIPLFVRPSQKDRIVLANAYTMLTSSPTHKEVKMMMIMYIRCNHHHDDYHHHL